jgi:uncharacterized protein with ParB-like and HNH nuclease domain
MDAGKKTISDVLNGNRILRIPFFQRAYVWEEKQWERFLEDMETLSTQNSPYFMGSLILKQERSKTSQQAGDIRQVVDGQQRLTTIAVFFKCMAQLKGDDVIFNRSFLLSDGSVAIEHNHIDSPSFEKIMIKKDLSIFPETKYQLEKLYNYIIQSNHNRFNIRNILNQIIFVGIDLDYEEDEQKIFDTINSLGIKLTTPELLKNYFFNKQNYTMYETHWKNIFEKDDETMAYWDHLVTSGSRERSFIEIFFFSVLQIVIQKPEFQVSTIEKKQFARQDELFDSYKTFISRYLHGNKLVMLELINKFQKVFVSIFDNRWLEKHISKNDYIARINNIAFGLDTASIISYVLYLVSENSEVSTENIDQMLSMVESFILRRMITKYNSKTYNIFFTSVLIGREINNPEKLRNTLLSEKEESTIFPSDEELKKGFENSKLTNKQAAGILYLIESQLRSKGQSTNLKPLNQYQLEHLLPKKWKEHWNSPPLNFQEEEIRNHTLLTLGNLAIISEPLNKSISNNGWLMKIHGVGSNKGLNILGGGIESVSNYLNFPIWNEETIAIRGQDLYHLALKIWKL